MNPELNQNLGIAILEGPLLRTLETLWEGPVAPENLEAIEQAIRAFLVSPTLIASRITGAASDSIDDPSAKAIYYEEPFGDHCLDYEFVHPQTPHPYSPIDKSESAYLSSLVTREVRARAVKALPGWIRKDGEAFAYLDAWYEGCTDKDCRSSAESMVNHEDEDGMFKGEESLHLHSLFHRGPAFQAEYYVGCHRAGLTVYGNSPLAHICNMHIFSRWPEYLFKTLGEQFKQASQELRGPGIGIFLPPLTLLLLARAPQRDEIPATLRDLRQEYLEARLKLWEMLSQMWFAPTFGEQMKILRSLRDAANSILPSAFPDGFNALSLAISASDLLAGSVSPILSNVGEQFRPIARVRAVSFASKLSKDLRHHLLNSREVLRRHFTKAELVEFGVA